MMMGSLIAMLLGFVGSALFSGVETGSYMLNRIRLKRRRREGHPSARILTKVLSYPYLFIYTVLICNNIANYLVSMGMTDLYLSAGLQEPRLILGIVPWTAEIAATLTLMFPLFLFAELGPKNLFRKKADTLMYRLSWMLQLLVLLLLPLTWPLKQLFRFLTHGAYSTAGRDLHRLSPDALREYFSVGEKEGFITSQQNRMLDNVTSMHRIPVRELMTPLKDIARLPDHATVADFKRLINRRETTYAILMHRHTAIGLVSMFTVIERKLDDDEVLKPYAEEMLALAENRNLKSAFYRLRRNPRHSAVVVDARNHPTGFIRLEDIAWFIAKKSG
jgi:CBS domain containing-hemolysin-like protein